MWVVETLLFQNPSGAVERDLNAVLREGPRSDCGSAVANPRPLTTFHDSSPRHSPRCSDPSHPENFQLRPNCVQIEVTESVKYHTFPLKSAWAGVHVGGLSWADLSSFCARQRSRCGVCVYFCCWEFERRTSMNASCCADENASCARHSDLTTTNITMNSHPLETSSPSLIRLASPELISEAITSSNQVRCRHIQCTMHIQYTMHIYLDIAYAQNLARCLPARRLHIVYNSARCRTLFF